MTFCATLGWMRAKSIEMSVCRRRYNVGMDENPYKADESGHPRRRTKPSRWPCFTAGFITAFVTNFVADMAIPGPNTERIRDLSILGGVAITLICMYGRAAIHARDIRNH